MMNAEIRNRVNEVVPAVGIATTELTMNRVRLVTMLFPQLNPPVTVLVGTVTMKQVLQQVIRTSDARAAASLRQPVTGVPSESIRPTVRF